MSSRNMIFALSLFILSFSSIAGDNCFETILNKYILCKRDGEFIVKVVNDSSLEFRRNGTIWNSCRNNQCKILTDDRKKLYFETTASLTEQEKFTRLSELETLNRSCEQKLELNEKSNKSSSTTIIDLNAFFLDRIREVEEESEYNQYFLDNLENLVSGYMDNYSFVMSQKFEKSSDYNKYEKPSLYLNDLYNYRLDLKYALTNLEWLSKTHDLTNFNISLNLEKNKRIKALFDEFTKVTGFPNNLDHIRDLINRKLETIKKEQKHMQQWIIDLKLEELSVFTNQIQDNMRFSNLINNTYENEEDAFVKEYNNLITSGKIVEAKNLFSKFEMRVGQIERILSYQTLNPRKRQLFDNFQENSESTLEYFRKQLYDLVETAKKSNQKINLFEIPSIGKVSERNKEEMIPVEGGNSSEGNEGNVGDVAGTGVGSDEEGEELYNILLPSEGVEVPFRMTASQRVRLGDLGGLEGDLGTFLFHLNSSGEERVISVNHLEQARQVVTEQFHELESGHSTYPITSNFNQVIEEIESNSVALELSQEGREIVQRNRELRTSLELTIQRRDESETHIREGIARAANVIQSDYQLRSEAKPQSSSVNRSDIANQIVLNTAYFGVGFVPVLGNITAVADFSTMLLTNKDLLGNDVATVEKVIGGFAILLPQIKGLKHGTLAVKGIIDFLKAGGVGALNKLRGMLKQGPKAFEAFVNSVGRAREVGLNLFEDFSENLWQSASVIIESSKKLFSIKGNSYISKFSKSFGEYVSDSAGNIDTNEILDIMNSVSKKGFSKKYKFGEFTPFRFSSINSVKLDKQMRQRGWTRSMIGETVNKPVKTIKTRDIRHRGNSGGRMDDPATAYINSDGSYIVRNDKTGDIVQISDRKSPNDWLYPEWHPKGKQ